jgi:hypothetical protein
VKEMANRDYIINQLNSLPESVLDKVQEFILFQRFNMGLFESDTEYLQSIPGMTESIMEGKATPINECLDSVGWDIR